MTARLIEQMFKSKPRLRENHRWCMTKPMMMRPIFGLCALALLLPAACTQFPALDSRATPERLAAEYPALVPVDPLLDTARAGQVDVQQAEAGLTTRARNLQARAARLRGTVLSGTEKQRLAQGVR
ncbi:hypothetical protein [Sulfitobacter sp.]|uniref:hypothetical protein n=1 Tax=Sulfitobacter sp. TaxID=1903071 RepID=UPI0035624735